MRRSRPSFVSLDVTRTTLEETLDLLRRKAKVTIMTGRYGPYVVKGKDVDAIALTHCHLDHVGSLPVAINHFPGAHVLMTELSYFIVERVLHNSVNVMLREREDRGVKDFPLYTHREVEEMAPLFQGFRYNREIEWAAFDKSRAGGQSPTLEFFDAGHTLGSAGVMVRGKRETLFYSGDVNEQS